MHNLIVNYAAEFSIVTRLISLIIIIVFVIPVMFREAKVQDRLKRLRWELFIFGIIHSFTNILSLYFLFDVALSSIPQKEINSWLQIINAICFFGLAIIGYSMYHTQYLEEE